MYWEKRNTFHFWKKKLYGNVGIVRFYVFLNFQIQVSLEKVLTFRSWYQVRIGRGRIVFRLCNNGITFHIVSNGIRSCMVVCTGSPVVHTSGWNEAFPHKAITRNKKEDNGYRWSKNKQTSHYGSNLKNEIIEVFLSFRYFFLLFGKLLTSWLMKCNIEVLPFSFFFLLLFLAYFGEQK